METKKEIKQKKGFFKKLLDNVAGNVKEGASLVGEKVAETSAKAYVASSELVNETSEKIHDFTEKQGLHKEERSILERQKQLTFTFGELTLQQYLANDSLHKSFLTTKAVSNVVETYQSNEKRMKAIASEIKKIENHK